MPPSADLPQASTGLVIGIAGGSGSGKTTVTERIISSVGPDHIAVIEHDAYYKDLNHLPLGERRRANFDHPDSLDTDLLVQHLRLLRAGQTAAVPTYDFTNYARRIETRLVGPKRVIIVEGILIFVEPALRALMDIKVFVDTDADVRLLRRLRRDLRERGRTLENAMEQYETTVRPMHLDFVEPSKRYADVIVPFGGQNTIALDLIVARIERMLRNVPSQ